MPVSKEDQDEINEFIDTHPDKDSITDWQAEIVDGFGVTYEEATEAYYAWHEQK